MVADPGVGVDLRRPRPRRGPARQRGPRGRRRRVARTTSTGAVPPASSAVAGSSGRCVGGGAAIRSVWVMAPSRPAGSGAVLSPDLAGATPRRRCAGGSGCRGAERSRPTRGEGGPMRACVPRPQQPLSEEGGHAKSFGAHVSLSAPAPLPSDLVRLDVGDRRPRGRGVSSTPAFHLEHDGDPYAACHTTSTRSVGDDAPATGGVRRADCRVRAAARAPSPTR